MCTRTLTTRTATIRTALPRALAFLALAAPLAAQSSWGLQAPLPTGADLHAVAQISPTTIWAAGSPGVVVHTTDGGATWQQQPIDTDSLWALFFVDAQRGWAAGNGLFHTTNGGANWIYDGAAGSVYDLFFLDAQRGWACANGGIALRTTNGGLTWSASSVGTITTLSSIFFVDAQNGWTVDIAGRIYRSTNGGQSWSLQFDADAYLSTLQFFDAQEGWAIGGDTFLRTTDGGQSWFAAIVPPNTWSHAARFADTANGISVGEFGNVTVTSDGGTTWTTVAEIGSGPQLFDVESWSSARSVHVGAAGALAMTSDGGSSWTSLQSGGTGSTHALDAVDALHAWAANDGGEVLRTVDGGNHWQRSVVTGFDHYGYIQDVDFHDTSLGWAVGRHEFFGPGIGRIARSTDGGASWAVQHSITGAYMEAVEVLDAETVLVLGQVPQGQRFVLRSTDAGASWTNVSPSQAILMDSDFVDPSIGWAVGGQIYKTTDGGLSWTGQHTPSEVLYSVSFADALHGWAVGWGPTILRTTDGGATWTAQSAGAPTSALFAVAALGPDVAWISGGNGFVARTTDGGASWQPIPPPGTADVVFEALCFLDTDRGWAGGDELWNRAPACPSPLPYCVAKPNSSGGLAAIGWQGSPSLATGDFAVSVTNALPGKLALFFYGSSGPASLPFHGGTLCAQPPLVRLPSFTLDAAGGGSQAITIEPGMLGTTRRFQLWHRDPAHPDGTGVALSNALQVEFCN